MTRTNSFLRMERNAPKKLRLFQLRDMAAKTILPETYADKNAAQRGRMAMARNNTVYEIVPGPDHHRYASWLEEHLRQVGTVVSQ
jgi:hypothetical protein